MGTVSHPIALQMAHAFATLTPRALATSAALNVSPSNVSANCSPRAIFARRLESSGLRSRLRERTSIMWLSLATVSSSSTPASALRIAWISVIPLFSAMWHLLSAPSGASWDCPLLSLWHLVYYSLWVLKSRTFYKNFRLHILNTTLALYCAKVARRAQS